MSNTHNDNVERRFLEVSKVAFKSTDSGSDSNTLVGYAATFNTLSQDMGGFYETIRPGAFTRSLERGDDVRALFNHGRDYVLGRMKSGTLTLTEDDNGLYFEVTLPDTTTARDLKESISRGDIDGCSFAFKNPVDRFFKQDGIIIREITDCELVDISPAVTFPAYLETSVSLRSLDKLKELQEETETPEVSEEDMDEVDNSSARARLRLAKHTLE
jgi:HK97 family phage prohead protease